MLRNKRAFTIVEVLVSSFIILTIFTSTVIASIFLKKAYDTWIVEVNAQQDCNLIISKVIRGNSEGGNLVGLRSAKSFTLPVVTPAGSRIDYIGKDGNTRSYFLNGNTIQYISPTQSPSQQMIYRDA